VTGTHGEAFQTWVRKGVDDARSVAQVARAPTAAISPAVGARNMRALAGRLGVRRTGVDTAAASQKAADTPSVVMTNLATLAFGGATGREPS
jgi:hypothetical protein